VTCLLAQGAFYLFPRISSFGIPSHDFCVDLLAREKVGVVPGSAFGAEGYIRLSYATSDEIIAKGVERLARYCKSLPPR
jgi:aspartate aminotransferase